MKINIRKNIRFRVGHKIVLENIKAFEGIENLNKMKRHKVKVIRQENLRSGNKMMVIAVVVKRNRSE